MPRRSRGPETPYVPVLGERTRRWPGIAIEYVMRGQRIMRSWQRPATAQENERKKPHIERWWQTLEASKRLTGEQMQSLLDMSRNTALTWRDVFFLITFGNAFPPIELPDRTLMPANVIIIVSRQLDAISQSPGSILMRGETYWSYIPPPDTDRVLARLAADTLPTWHPLSDLPISGGGGRPTWTPIRRTNAHPGNTLYATPMVLTSTATLTGIGVIPTMSSGTWQCRAGIYDGTATQPGTLLAATDEITGCTANTVNYMPFATPWTPPTDALYWIALTYNSAINIITIDAGTLGLSLARTYAPLPTTSPTLTSTALTPHFLLRT